MRTYLSSMEFLPNDIEMKLLQSNKLTKPPDEVNDHYSLLPQRGCFVRCQKCVNLSQADSYEKDGIWHWSTECAFCVQRLIDLLGYYEHGVVPRLTVSGRAKRRSHPDGSLYAALLNAANSLDDEIVEPPADVFADCVGED